MCRQSSFDILQFCNTWEQPPRRPARYRVLDKKGALLDILLGRRQGVNADAFQRGEEGPCQPSSRGNRNTESSGAARGRTQRRASATATTMKF